MSENWYETKDHGFRQEAPGDAALEVVGHCTDCGFPIYGPKFLERGRSPACQYSCQCWMKRYVANQG